MPSPAFHPLTKAQRPEWLVRLGLVLGSLIVGLLALELALRTSYGYLLLWPNFVVSARTVLADRDSSRYVHDGLLGYVPRPGSFGPDYSGPGAVIEAGGLRRTGDLPPAATIATTVAETARPILGPILAVGDSFTFGDEVGDTETWPAHLQRLTGRRVLNGGVSGYGFDQIVLRAEALAAALRPQAIVVGFIADDIRRTEMRRLWSADKPWFDLEGDRPVLRGVPVPPRAEPRSTLNFWQRTLGYSFLFEFTLRHLDLLHDWFGDHLRAGPSGSGEQLACRLTGRLAELQKKSGARLLIVAQYDPVVWQDPAFAAEQRRMTAQLLGCARQAGLETLDSFDVMAARAGKEGPRGFYGLWHMNDRGNRLIADTVAAALGKSDIGKHDK